jgi:hypothetical protein
LIRPSARVMWLVVFVIILSYPEDPKDPGILGSNVIIDVAVA